MSYAGDLDVVARLLGVIAIHGSAELTERDLDIALVARSSVLELASTVQFHLTGQRGGALGSPMPNLEAHPTATFARSLVQYPRVPGPASPTDAVAAEPDSDIGRAWQRIARHAISANHHWTTGSVRPSGPVAWAGLADIAAMSAVIAELDGELADSARRSPHRQELAERLAAGTTSGLRTAARQVCELAAAGPLPRGPEPRPVGNRGLVTITKPGDLTTAHEQLANLLVTAAHVRPETHGLLVIGHLRTCRALLKALPAQPSELRAALEQHEQALTEITRHPVQAASITGGDTRPPQQMQIIRQAARVGSSLMRELADDPVETARLATAIADTTTALRETADKHVSSRAWLLPDPHAEHLRWAPARFWHTAPRFLQELRAAAVQGEQVRIAAKPINHRDGTAPVPARLPASARNLLYPAPFRPLIPSRFAVRPVHPRLPVAPVTHHRRR